MKVYISGAITGTTDYITRFHKAQKQLMKLGCDVVNPTIVNAMLPSSTTYEEYMKMSMCMLDMCDTIYLLKGWQDSRGANREYGYALARGMTVICEEEYE